MLHASRAALAVLPLALFAGSCAQVHGPGPRSLRIVAESEHRWTGVAMTPDGRLFVCFPRWEQPIPMSVAVLEDGEPRPYPNAEWNAWTRGSELDPARHFVCVQSVHVDARGRLWILDPANPQFDGVVSGGPKLVLVDPGRDEVVDTWTFGPEIAGRDSYLNDVRVDPVREVAYLSDSGTGALIVLDLETRRARRVLDEHPSTHADAIDIRIENRLWLRDGKTPQIHCDGIALSPDRAWIYYQALTSRTLYRVPTAALRDRHLTASQLAERVEGVGRTGVADGILFGRDGSLYLTALEQNAVNRLTPRGALEFVFFDDRLDWPDSFALGLGEEIYLTTAQIHLGPRPVAPFRIWRFVPPPLQ